MTPIAPTTRTTLISCEYDASGLVWIILHDNTVISWLIDEGGALPPVPMILGNMPPPGPATAPILSPAWAVRDDWAFLIPNMARGSPQDLFTFLATNNGAQRRLFMNFADTGLINDFSAWARSHPTLVLAEKPQ